MYTNYMEAMQWIEETDVLEMIVDKFSSSVSNINCIEPVDVSDCVRYSIDLFFPGFNSALYCLTLVF